ncbi:MAG: hypothetical protein OCD03_17000, partial [Hyphomicrobiales bacterium]
FWQFINEWMQKKSNLAMFGQYLDDVPLESYSPFEAPITTIAKDEMSDLNKTHLDRLIYDALNEMDGIFVAEQVLKRIAEIELQSSFKLPDHWQDIAKKKIRSKAHPVLSASNGERIRPQIGGKRYNVLHMDSKKARQFSGTKKVRNSLFRNGDVFTVNSTVQNNTSAYLRLVKFETKDE